MLAVVIHALPSSAWLDVCNLFFFSKKLLDSLGMVTLPFAGNAHGHRLHSLFFSAIGFGSDTVELCRDLLFKGFSAELAILSSALSTKTLTLFSI